MPVDLLRVERISDSGGTTFDNFTSAQVVNDIAAPSEAAFELGDDGTWNEINEFVAPGSQYKVYVNDSLRLTGKVEVDDVQTDAASGSVVRFTVRSKLSDAWYASADPSIKGKGTSIKDFVLAHYAQFGFGPDDFVFDADVSRDLMTGRSKTTGRTPTDLEPIREDQLQANPPESVYMTVDRVLRRFGLMHWDSPDGRIVVSSPNDEQDPTYHFRMMFGGQGRENNILTAGRVRDWTQVASSVAMYGNAGNWSSSRVKIRSIETDDEVISAGFHRPIIVIAESLTSQDRVDKAARRERVARSKDKDAWQLTVDGFSHFVGADRINYATDTTADIVSAVAGGPAGAYYVHRTTLNRTAGEGDVTMLEMLRRGVWVL